MVGSGPEARISFSLVEPVRPDEVNKLRNEVCFYYEHWLGMLKYKTKLPKDRPWNDTISLAPTTDTNYKLAACNFGRMLADNNIRSPVFRQRVVDKLYKHIDSVGSH